MIHSKKLCTCILLLFLAACSSQSGLPPEITGQAATVTQADDGLVVIRAEQFQTNTPRGQHRWELQKDASTPTDITLVALPDGDRAVSHTNSPQLDYQIDFTKSGTHYVWVYGQAAAKNPYSGDSLNLGLNGTIATSASRVSYLKPYYGWVNKTMSNTLVTLQIPKPGTYTLNVWMREDGTRFSAIALSNNPEFRPTQNTLSAQPEPAANPQPIDDNIAPVQARSADTFIDTVGVNTHLHFSDTVWGKKYNEIIKPKLLASGIRHIRDGIKTYEAASRDSFYYVRLRELGAAGLRFSLVTDMDTRSSDMTNFNLLDDVQDWTNGAIASFEGVNEPELQGVSNWRDQTHYIQRKLYETVNRAPSLANVKVIGPAPSRDNAVTELGDMSDLMDYGNSHAYTGGAMPMLTGYGSLQFNLEKTAKISASDPVFITEVGYHNAIKTTMTHPPTTEGVAAVYIPRMYLSYFNEGIARTFLYEFIDTQPDSSLSTYNYHFGLLRNDGSEKPAYVAVKNLLNLLKDPGSNFTPGSLRFSLSGNTENVYQTLLQKRDGTFYLALWVEESSWDRDARRELTVPNRTVDLQLGDRVGTVTRYAFDENGNAPASHLMPENGKLSLSLNDKLTIIAFAPPEQ